MPTKRQQPEHTERRLYPKGKACGAADRRSGGFRQLLNGQDVPGGMAALRREPPAERTGRGTWASRQKNPGLRMEQDRGSLFSSRAIGAMR
jgi:hypothetical protein